MTTDRFLYRVLNEIDVAFARVLDLSPDRTGLLLTRWEKAERRLDVEVGPGFTSRTPGNGDPGGGRGAKVTAQGSDDSQGPDAYSITERIALDQTKAELLDLADLRAGPLRCLAYTLWLIGPVGLALDLPTRAPVARLTWCRNAVLEVLADDELVDKCQRGRCQPLHRAASELEHITVRWGFDPAKPVTAKVERDALATDLTEMWCRSCLRVGQRSPRHRGDLCKWCYEFDLTEHFLPPPDIIEARASGKRITEQMVAPHRKAHRERRRRGRRR